MSASRSHTYPLLLLSAAVVLFQLLPPPVPVVPMLLLVPLLLALLLQVFAAAPAVTGPNACSPALLVLADVQLTTLPTDHSERQPVAHRAALQGTRMIFQGWEDFDNLDDWTPDIGALLLETKRRSSSVAATKTENHFGRYI